MSDLAEVLQAVGLLVTAVAGAVVTLVGAFKGFRKERASGAEKAVEELSPPRDQETERLLRELLDERRRRDERDES